MAARHYELMIILAPDLEERTITPSLEQFLTVIRNSGGTVEKVDVWGRRRLSYEINKNFEGIYAIVELLRRAGRHHRAGPSAQPERIGHAHQGDTPSREEARCPPSRRSRPPVPVPA